MSGFAVVDCETTGLDPIRDRIIEVAIVQLREDATTEYEWSTLVNPRRPVAARFIHGITDADVANAPFFSEIAPAVAALLAERVFVAHNAAFDAAFLNAAFAAAAVPFSIPQRATACTMELSKIYLPPGRHSLVDAAHRAGLLPQRRHRALADARTAADLLRVYMAHEAAGVRYRQLALGRDGSQTLPAAWSQAQQWAADLTWPAAHQFDQL
ncbi:MAG: 3'-5' exonuclease [Ancrocorticia sp.]|nr:3'-5' exonuclease [Ancrocorticia sp.]MCI1932378.1 3'-5' exonuclease [Ancrocorticia sp.]MCI2012344.1 3'-5' exonuclease [Ancrocorticia sp.]MCI2028975.1 3'-5' exonuclease [Ancrocorticia sp.]MCI2178858.1 3'-5' exonuclease [Ancrocorticia sp.]